MRQIRRAWKFMLWSATLLLTACGGEGDVSPVPQSGDLTPEGVVVSGSLVESGRPDPLVGVVLNLVDTRIPTAELLEDLPDSVDAQTVRLVRRLRSEFFRRRDQDWSANHRMTELGEKTVCTEEALRWHRGVAVEVYALRLPDPVAERHATNHDFGPLRTSKAECLADAANGGYAVRSYDRVVLRAEETARLAVGWTRARLNTNGANDHPDRDWWTVTFAGLRVAVSAHAVDGENGAWELGVFAKLGGLDSETGVKVDEDGPFQESNASYQYRHNGGERLRLATEERCWLARFSGGRGLLVGSPEQPTTQVLLCARVVDID